MASRKDDDLQERVARERSAPRLASVVPSLTGLRILVRERSGMGQVTYRKHFQVGSAPALFVIGCGDERCRDGGHDITIDVMRALRAHQLKAEGHHACDGRTGTAGCVRTIDFELIAEYQPPH